jgi:ferredoxin-type protein NapG
MADGKKLSRRALLTFWRRGDEAPTPAAAVPESERSRRWPRERVPGSRFGQELPLRPPGNLQEYILRDACTRCGQCVQACPADAIFSLDSTWGAAQGTPAIDARKQPCVLCDGFQCTQVCPSGALQPLYNVAEIRMGTALVDEARCATYRGQRCDACVTVCPVGGAIFTDADGHPKVAEHVCVGCGLCVRACPTEPASIVVIPRD